MLVHFPVMIRFSKLFFEDVGQINAVAGLNIQDEEDAIRELKKVEQEMEQNQTVQTLTDLILDEIKHIGE